MKKRGVMIILVLIIFVLSSVSVIGVVAPTEATAKICKETKTADCVYSYDGNTQQWRDICTSDAVHTYEVVDSCSESDNQNTAGCNPGQKCEGNAIICSSDLFITCGTTTVELCGETSSTYPNRATTYGGSSVYCLCGNIVYRRASGNYCLPASSSTTHGGKVYTSRPCNSETTHGGGCMDGAKTALVDGSTCNDIDGCTCSPGNDDDMTCIGGIDQEIEYTENCIDDMTCKDANEIPEFSLMTAMIALVGAVLIPTVLYKRK